MQLTDEQVATIARWAESTPLISEVRLFGSRARGDARPDSDIDVAVTVGGKDRGFAAGSYFSLGDRWQRDLARLLGCHVSLEWWPPDEADVLAIVRKEAILIWSRA